jgi:peptide methionine sulfoxide reductase msrA/msrB
VETVLIAFGAAHTSYEALLETFFENHEPGFAKPGSQYRSVIFALNADQERQASAAVQRWREAGQTIATNVETIQEFWPAEAYHQQYYERRGLAKPSPLPCAVPESEFAPAPPAPIHGW